MSRNRWLKAHIMIGTRTNIVTGVEVTSSSVHDSPMLPALLNTSAKRFDMERISADKGYLSNANLKAIAELGAAPFIPFKSNTREGEIKGLKNSALRHKMLHYYLYRKDDFRGHYHKRSNVETTFHMIKAKLGSRIRYKTEVAQVNEILCKVLCHNLCCLVQSVYELGIKPEFWKAS